MLSSTQETTDIATPRCRHSSTLFRYNCGRLAHECINL
jgi:hypothetical protein